MRVPRLKPLLGRPFRSLKCRPCRPTVLYPHIVFLHYTFAMAPSLGYLQPTFWVILALQATFAEATFWTATSNYELSLSVRTLSYYSYVDYDTYTSTRTIKSGVTPTVAAISTSTYVQ